MATCTRVLYDNAPRYFGDADPCDDTSEGYGVVRESDLTPDERAERRAAHQQEWLKKLNITDEATKDVIKDYLAKPGGPLVPRAQVPRARVPEQAREKNDTIRVVSLGQAKLQQMRSKSKKSSKGSAGGAKSELDRLVEQAASDFNLALDDAEKVLRSGRPITQADVNDLESSYGALMANPDQDTADDYQLLLSEMKQRISAQADIAVLLAATADVNAVVVKMTEKGFFEWQARLSAFKTMSTEIAARLVALEKAFGARFVAFSESVKATIAFYRAKNPLTKDDIKAINDRRDMLKIEWPSVSASYDKKLEALVLPKDQPPAPGAASQSQGDAASDTDVASGSEEESLEEAQDAAPASAPAPAAARPASAARPNAIPMPAGTVQTNAYAIFQDNPNLNYEQFLRVFTEDYTKANGAAYSTQDTKSINGAWRYYKSLRE